MAKNGSPRIAILGAGPIGLEAALYARSLQLPVTIYERGRVGEHIQRWGHVRLFTPFGMNSTPLGRSTIQAENPKHTFPAETDCTTGKEHFALYLEPLAKSTLLRDCLRTDAGVIAVGRRGLFKGDDADDDKRAKQSFRLLIRDNQKKERFEEADLILDCTGTYGQHRWLGDGGIPAIGEQTAENQIAYNLEDVRGERRTFYANKTILVVGGGHSAATTVCQLAELAETATDTWVIWLARCAETQPLRRRANDPLRERDRLALRANTLATRTDANVEFHNQTVIDSVESLGQDKGFRVAARRAGQTRTWDVERIIANVGYTPGSNLYRELHIHECFATLGPVKIAAALQKQRGLDCLQLSVPGSELRTNPEPNFYILGGKSYGRNSGFLLRAGFEQVRDVFSRIAGESGLDLYKKR